MGLDNNWRCSCALSNSSFHLLPMQEKHISIETRTKSDYLKLNASGRLVQQKSNSIVKPFMGSAEPFIRSKKLDVGPQ